MRCLLAMLDLVSKAVRAGIRVFSAWPQVASVGVKDGLVCGTHFFSVLVVACDKVLERCAEIAKPKAFFNICKA